jgi:Tfp pilus assembly protein PilN
MKTRLNVATTPLVGNRRFGVAAAVIAVIGLGALFLLSNRAFQMWRSETAFRIEQAQIDSDLDRLQTERQDLEQFFNRPESIQRRDLANFLNSLIAQRAFPWTRIFMDFEHTLPPGVRVISIEPHLVNNYVQLRLTIGATSDQNKLEFLRALETSKSFSHIEVEGERHSDQGGVEGGSGETVVLLEARYSAA